MENGNSRCTVYHHSLVLAMKLSLAANGMSTGTRALVELRDPHKALMADLSSAIVIQPGHRKGVVI